MDFESAEKELEAVISQTQDLIEDAQELINTSATYRRDAAEFSVKEEIVESTNEVESLCPENDETESRSNVDPASVEASTRLDHSYDTSSPQDVRNDRLSPEATITLNDSCNDDVVYVCSNVLSEGYVETIDLTSISHPTPNSKKSKRRRITGAVDLTHSPAGVRGDVESGRPELKCGVCLENMLASSNMQPMSTICGHLFCRNCITQDIFKRSSMQDVTGCNCFYICTSLLVTLL